MIEELHRLRQAQQVYTPLADPNIGNTNPELIATGPQSFGIAETNTLYDWSIAGNNFTPVNLSELAIADTTNGYGNYVHEITSTLDTYSYLRHRWACLLNEVFEYYFYYRITVGGARARLTFTGENPTILEILNTDGNWHMLSGTVTASADGFMQCNPSMIHGGTAASTGEKLQYKLTIKKQ